jgi:hypothetical protein
MSAGVASAGGASAQALAGIGTPARILFVDHASQLSGAELVLADIVTSYSRDSTVFLFEDGPLRPRLASIGIRTVLPKRAVSFRSVWRDSNPLDAIPLTTRMLSLVKEIATRARAHDLVYANSQKWVSPSLT